jgi:hypothetical protein
MNEGAAHNLSYAIPDKETMLSTIKFFKFTANIKDNTKKIKELREMPDLKMFNINDQWGRAENHELVTAQLKMFLVCTADSFPSQE